MQIDLFELRRETVHMMTGILLIFIILFLPRPKFILLGILALGGLAGFLSAKIKISIITKCLSLFERRRNKDFPGKGVLFFFIGSLLSLQLFSREIALASILILTFADPVSHFIGQNFEGIIKLNKKYIRGTLSGIIIGTIFSCFFVHVYLALIGAFFAMLLETLEIAVAGQTIDDNLLIPLVAGTVMHFASALL